MQYRWLTSGSVVGVNRYVRIAKPLGSHALGHRFPRVVKQRQIESEQMLSSVFSYTNQPFLQSYVASLEQRIIALEKSKEGSVGIGEPIALKEIKRGDQQQSTNSAPRDFNSSYQDSSQLSTIRSLQNEEADARVLLELDIDDEVMGDLSDSSPTRSKAKAGFFGRITDLFNTSPNCIRAIIKYGVYRRIGQCDVG